jgi:hypothetical protein
MSQMRRETEVRRKAEHFAFVARLGLSEDDRVWTASRLSTAVQSELFNTEIADRSVCRLLVVSWSRREHGPSSKSPRKQKTSAESGHKRYREFKMRVSLFTADVSSFAQTPQCDASTN